MRALLHAGAAAAFLGAATAAGAFEAVVSAGIDDLGGNGEATVGLELRTAPLAAAGRAELGLAAAVETEGDVWGGAGPLAFYAVTPAWRLEASVMIGAYVEGGGNDLGAEFPVFRSQIGASRRFAESWRFGLSVNHKSNAGTGRRNPGVETVLLSLARRF